VIATSQPTCSVRRPLKGQRRRVAFTKRRSLLKPGGRWSQLRRPRRTIVGNKEGHSYGTRKLPPGLNRVSAQRGGKRTIGVRKVTNKEKKVGP